VAFAEAVLELRDSGMRRELGENGKRAVLERYNWAAAGGRLAGLYELLERRAESSRLVRGMSGG
jgi:hypothetical protein